MQDENYVNLKLFNLISASSSERMLDNDFSSDFGAGVLILVEDSSLDKSKSVEFEPLSKSIFLVILRHELGCGTRDDGLVILVVSGW